MKTMKKTLIVVAFALLLVCCVVSTTLAYLVAQTPSVENTFVIGNINIKLGETVGNEFKLIPGSTYTKDPTVEVLPNSESCYLFVKVERTTNFNNYITCNIDGGNWSLLNTTGTYAVYYREIGAVDAKNGVKYNVIDGNTVTVKSTVTKADIDALGGSNPKITFTAYAVQLTKDGTNKFTPEEAWTVAQTGSLPTT